MVKSSSIPTDVNVIYKACADAARMLADATQQKKNLSSWTFEALMNQLQGRTIKPCWYLLNDDPAVANDPKAAANDHLVTVMEIMRLQHLDEDNLVFAFEDNALENPIDYRTYPFKAVDLTGQQYFIDLANYRLNMLGKTLLLTSGDVDAFADKSALWAEVEDFWKELEAGD